MDDGFSMGVVIFKRMDQPAIDQSGIRRIKSFDAVERRHRTGGSLLRIAGIGLALLQRGGGNADPHCIETMQSGKRADIGGNKRAIQRPPAADKLAGEMMRIRAHACAISRAAARPARRPSAIAVSRPLPEA